MKIVIEGNIKDMMEELGDAAFYIIKFDENGDILGMVDAHNGMEISMQLAGEEGHYMIIDKEGAIREDNTLMNGVFVHKPMYKPVMFLK